MKLILTAAIALMIAPAPLSGNATPAPGAPCIYIPGSTQNLC